MGTIVIVSGLPFGVGLIVFLLFGFLPTVGYIIWLSVREAKRQGWGSNLR